MNKQLVMAAGLLCLFTSGCERREPAVEGAEPSRASTSRPESPRPIRSATTAVLAEGYVPSFEHKIRSQRHVASGPKYRHVVIVEYMDIDAEAVIQALRSDLTAAGFTVSEQAQHGEGIRLPARGKSGVLMASDVYGPQQLKLQNPDARGIVYFGWVDKKPR